MKSLVYYLVSICIILISCNKNEKMAEKETREPFYMINLPDTVTSGVPFVFEIKLSYPTSAKKENYFAYLILSDSVKITLDNVLEKAEQPYDILELDINHWKVRRTIYKKGNFKVNGGIYVHTIETEDLGKDSIKLIEHENIIPIEKEIYIK